MALFKKTADLKKFLKIIEKPAKKTYLKSCLKLYINLPWR